MDKNELEKSIRCITHEINNGLSICDVYTRIVRKTLEKDNYQNRSVTNALNCIEQSLKLIGSEITLLRSFNPKNFHNVQLNSLIEDAAELSSAYIKDQKIEFVIKLAEDVTVIADECKLKAVLINLFKNGIEAIKESGYIYAETKKLNDKIQINIGNTGAKISSSTAEKIFQESYTTKKSGSGIGLYMCKQSVEEIGGTIQLLSSTAKKTVFSIELPIIG